MSNNESTKEAQPAQSSMKERLLAACDGHPYAKIAWPHHLLHDAIAEIDRLESVINQPRCEKCLSPNVEPSKYLESGAHFCRDGMHWFDKLAELAAGGAK